MSEGLYPVRGMRQYMGGTLGINLKNGVNAEVPFVQSNPAYPRLASDGRLNIPQVDPAARWQAYVRSRLDVKA